MLARRSFLELNKNWRYNNDSSRFSTWPILRLIEEKSLRDFNYHANARLRNLFISITNKSHSHTAVALGHLARTVYDK